MLSSPDRVSALAFLQQRVLNGRQIGCPEAHPD
jgi:hypothetical protein